MLEDEELRAAIDEARAEGDFARVLSLLDLAAADTYEPSAKANWLRERARVCEEELADVAAAIDAWREVLSLDPGAQDALEALVRLLTAAEDYAGVVHVLRREAELAPDPSYAADQWERIARLYEEYLGDDAAATEARSRAAALRAGG